MKANRPARSTLRRFGDDERGVSEAVGYVITFGISTVILLTSLTAFNEIRDFTTELAMDKTAKEVAAQTAFAVEEALRAGAKYPEMDFAMRLTLPGGTQGVGYTVEVYENHVWVIADNADAAREETLSGDAIETRGRGRADFIEAPGALVLCPTADPAVVDGFCTVRSDAGEFQVVYRDRDRNPATTDDSGVFLTRA